MLTGKRINSYFISLLTFCLVFVGSIPANADDIEKLGQYENLIVELYYQGKYADALELAKEGLNWTQTTFGSDSLANVLMIDKLGMLYEVVDQLDLSEQCYMTSLRILDKNFEKNDPGFTATLVSLGELYRRQGRLAEAEAVLMRAKNNNEAAYGEDTPKLRTVYNNLAMVFVDQGRQKEAENYYLRTISICRKNNLLDLDYATTLRNTANLYIGMEKHEEAYPYVAEALEFYDTEELSLHPSKGNLLGSLATIAEYKQDLALAELCYVQSFKIFVDCYGVNHHLTEASIRNVYSFYMDHGQDKNAQDFLDYVNSLVAKQQ